MGAPEHSEDDDDEEAAALNEEEDEEDEAKTPIEQQDAEEDHVIGEPQAIYGLGNSAVGGSAGNVESSSSTTQKTLSVPRVYFHAEHLPSTRRRSSCRLLGPQASYRRRSRSMSAWTDLSRSSIRFDERFLSGSYKKEVSSRKLFFFFLVFLHLYEQSDKGVTELSSFRAHVVYTGYRVELARARGRQKRYLHAAERRSLALCSAVCHTRSIERAAARSVSFRAPIKVSVLCLTDRFSLATTLPVGYSSRCFPRRRTSESRTQMLMGDIKWLMMLRSHKLRNMYLMLSVHDIRPPPPFLLFQTNAKLNLWLLIERKIKSTTQAYVYNKRTSTRIDGCKTCICVSTYNVLLHDKPNFIKFASASIVTHIARSLCQTSLTMGVLQKSLHYHYYHFFLFLFFINVISKWNEGPRQQYFKYRGCSGYTCARAVSSTSVEKTSLLNRDAAVLPPSPPSLPPLPTATGIATTDIMSVFFFRLHNLRRQADEARKKRQRGGAGGRGGSGQASQRAQSSCCDQSQPTAGSMQSSGRIRHGPSKLFERVPLQPSDSLDEIAFQIPSVHRRTVSGEGLQRRVRRGPCCTARRSSTRFFANVNLISRVIARERRPISTTIPAITTRKIILDVPLRPGDYCAVEQLSSRLNVRTTTTTAKKTATIRTENFYHG
ncbi:unnamed protein product [Trichogramma brassicae]|uniref:Uncharacterized protein n=1 Tax=Trichogramma brassicae TaxID=86971 RepID=A0A6H5HU73_9HYME|nr:unnamed protein product [Trichogramma brassicae]